MSAPGESRNWSEWHQGYDDPDSPQARRLAIIQKFIGRWLDTTAPRPVTILSLCAGDGRDLIQVLGDREDRRRATVTLIERDENNVARARREAAIRELSNVRMIQADAGLTASFSDAVPADMIIIAGVFGHLSDRDIRTTIQALPGMCNSGAEVLWTRRRRPAGILQRIAGWFEAEGFEEVPIPSREKTVTHIGAHRYSGRPRLLGDDRRLFAFRPDEE